MSISILFEGLEFLEWRINSYYIRIHNFLLVISRFFWVTLLLLEKLFDTTLLTYRYMFSYFNLWMECGMCFYFYLRIYILDFNILENPLLYPYVKQWNLSVTQEVILWSPCSLVSFLSIETRICLFVFFVSSFYPSFSFSFFLSFISFISSCVEMRYDKPKTQNHMKSEGSSLNLILNGLPTCNRTSLSKGFGMTDSTRVYISNLRDPIVYR